MVLPWDWLGLVAECRGLLQTQEVADTQATGASLRSLACRAGPVKAPWPLASVPPRSRKAVGVSGPAAGSLPRGRGQSPAKRLLAQ